MKKGQIIAISAFVILTIGLYLLPLSPSPQAVAQKEEAKSNANQQEMSLDAKVDEAVLIIQNADGAPMRGIGMLREVLEVNPNHVKANYWLGEFSWISGQLEKAVPRFEKVLEVEPSNAEAAKRLATVYTQLKNVEKAKDVLNTFIEKNPNSDALDEMTAMLNNI